MKKILFSLILFFTVFIVKAQDFPLVNKGQQLTKSFGTDTLYAYIVKNQNQNGNAGFLMLTGTAKSGLFTSKDTTYLISNKKMFIPDAIFNSIKLQTGAGAGKVILSDANGNFSWGSVGGASGGNADSLDSKEGWHYEDSLFVQYCNGCKTELISGWLSKYDTLKIDISSSGGGVVDTTILATKWYVNDQIDNIVIPMVDTTNTIATKYYVNSQGFLTTEVDGDITNELQDTTEIPGLQEFVENYSINSYTETDPVWNSQKASYATTSQLGAKSDSSAVALLATANTFTKANTFNSSVLLPNAVATTTAPSILVLENNVIKKDVLIDINQSTVEKISTDSLTAGFPITFGGLSSFIGVQVLVDDGSIILPSGVAGFGTIQIGDNQEYARFTFTSAGVVSLLENSPNVVNTDTDTKLCIFDSGTTVTIRNRLGSQLKLRYTIYYSSN